ncbi:MAG: Na+/H+ antiporter NhaC [Proteobacteria bacterium]|uniref:Na+/H+ antiporter NhaC n=1 Tax=Candidatus Avisuccinivibrio stercorigallinarum TaxID=2840704 RepID=A0A9D9GTH4_9GAMM|nr:Na+/H+ antiporter NhaC [Candidatus Avisuccinivibrio stercorigallinarum]
MSRKVREKKELTFFWAIVPVFAMILFLGVGYIALNLRAEPMILLSAATASIIAYFHGYSWGDILDAIVEKLAKAMPAILILITVGFLIGAWMIGGTIPMMVYYGLKYIDPSYFYVAAFLLTAITATCTGTSWGSAGTIGVALMGVAVGLNLSLPVAAGAILSGAYFGDKCSPLSDSTNLASIAAGSPLYAHIAHLFWTTGPGFIICCIAYTFIGLNQHIGHIDTPERIVEITSSLEAVYDFNLLVLLPPVVVLAGSILRQPTIPVLFLASVIAMFCGSVFQGFTLSQICETVIGGFSLSMIPNQEAVAAFPPDVSRLLERGGMVSMMGTLVICFCAFALAGSMSVANSLKIIISVFLKGVHSVFRLIATTLVSTILICGITSNGQLSVLLPGEMFKETYKKFGLAPTNLSRTAEDAGTVVEPILPWTAAGVYMATMLGVPTLEYLPWAFLNYTGMIFALIWAATGIGITRLPKTAEDK